MNELKLYLENEFGSSTLLTLFILFCSATATQILNNIIAKTFTNDSSKYVNDIKNLQTIQEYNTDQEIVNLSVYNLKILKRKFERNIRTRNIINIAANLSFYISLIGIILLMTVIGFKETLTGLLFSIIFIFLIPPLIKRSLWVLVNILDISIIIAHRNHETKYTLLYKNFDHHFWFLIPLGETESRKRLQTFFETEFYGPQRKKIYPTNLSHEEGFRLEELAVKITEYSPIIAAKVVTHRAPKITHLPPNPNDLHIWWENKFVGNTNYYLISPVNTK